MRSQNIERNCCKKRIEVIYTERYVYGGGGERACVDGKGAGEVMMGKSR